MVEAENNNSIKIENKTELLGAKFTQSEKEYIISFIKQYNEKYHDYFKNPSDFYRTAIFSLIHNLSLKIIDIDALDASAKLLTDLLEFNKAINTMQDYANAILEFTNLIKTSTDKLEIKELIKQIRKEPIIRRNLQKYED